MHGRREEDMMVRDLRRGLTLSLTILVAVLGPPGLAGAAPAAKPQVVLVMPFDASGTGADWAWVGQAVAEVLTLGLSQHPAFVQIDPARLRAFGQPEAWGESAVVQAARSLRADTALFGTVTRAGSDFTIRARLLEVKGTGADVIGLEPLTFPGDELLAQLPGLVSTYARTMKVPLTDAETARIEKAARPTNTLRAFELYARSQQAAYRGGQEGNESAADLLARAIEADPSFVVAQYSLGRVHQALGNRWKAAAQYRAATQLDPLYPEPYKALGDLLLLAPRRLFDQAVEAYQKAIERRPFYADAHVGLGDALAAKGDVDGAINAYQRALTFHTANPRVHVSLGKIYYSEKGLYYESVNAYKRAIDLDARSIEARMGLGEVYEEKGLYKEAIDEYRRVIETEPLHAEALYNLALVYEKVDPREAITHWERYIALASQIPAQKDWVDVARQHLRKLRNQVKD
ncbi:MAG TPA: tetratricopeptide repeat protein [Methylomirabilota bacterium]|jgi:tetratricopeptide (TPR) repeat protein/TolB-like protein